MPERLYFFDTVSLSNFALVDRLVLLIERYGPRIHITQEVLGEISEGIAVGYARLRQVEEAVAQGEVGSAMPLSAGERDDYRQLLRSLGPGEASCIACAQSRGGVVVTDDRAARSHCGERGLAVTGTIGLLKACCLDGALTPHQADEALLAMIDAGFYAPVRRISDLL